MCFNEFQSYYFNVVFKFVFQKLYLQFDYNTYAFKLLKTFTISFCKCPNYFDRAQILIEYHAQW